MIRGCADRILDDYDDVPVRSHILTLAHKRTRECLRQEHCEMLLDDEPEPSARRLLAELLGSAFLAAIVIGSGIAAQRLSPGNVGLQLFENAAATAAGLFAIILMFGPVSGGHFNPVVSLVDASFGGLSLARRARVHRLPRSTGCILGAITANAMFALAAISISTKHRATPAHLFAEVIATLGLCS